MTTLTEGRHPGEFILSEAKGTRSRETETIVSGQNLQAGTVLGRITATGFLTEYDSSASDGSQAVYGILFDNVDASAGDVPGAVVIVRDAEVQKAALEWIDAANETAGTPGLKALGIVVRKK